GHRGDLGDLKTSQSFKKNGRLRYFSDKLFMHACGEIERGMCIRHGGSRARIQTIQGLSLLVVNDSLVELALRALDVLLNGDGLAVFGERYGSGSRSPVGADSVAAVLINRVAVVSDLGHLLATGDHRIGLAIGFAIESLIDGCAVGSGAANAVL